MKDLKPIRGRHYIESLVAEGEHERQDFKFLISDARKIARSISAFANHKGGHLLIGVKDNGTLAGVRNEEDIFVVEQAAHRYCVPSQSVTFTAFAIHPGVTVIRATVAPAHVRPVMVQESPTEQKAYVRVADSNVAAHPLMVRMWQYNSAGNNFSFSDTESDVLAYIAGRTDGTDPRETSLALHISQNTAEDIIVRLAAMELLEFRHTGSGFRIFSK